MRNARTGSIGPRRHTLTAAVEGVLGIKGRCPGLKKVSLPVTGMSCASCAAKIEGFFRPERHTEATNLRLRDRYRLRPGRSAPDGRKTLGTSATAGVESRDIREGMSCAPALRRYGRPLTPWTVISASVNFAAERADINTSPRRRRDDLVAVNGPATGRWPRRKSRTFQRSGDSKKEEFERLRTGSSSPPRLRARVHRPFHGFSTGPAIGKH